MSLGVFKAGYDREFFEGQEQQLKEVEPKMVQATQAWLGKLKEKLEIGRAHV
jgi:hypothetical protein